MATKRFSAQPRQSVPVPRPSRFMSPKTSLSRPPLPEPLAAAASELSAHANLGPKSAQALVAAGIATFAELQRLGSVAAYAKTKQHDPKVTLNLLWALEGALSALPWQTVAKEHRTSLLLALEQYQNGG